MGMHVYAYTCTKASIHIASSTVLYAQAENIVTHILHSMGAKFRIICCLLEALATFHTLFSKI